MRTDMLRSFLFVGLVALSVGCARRGLPSLDGTGEDGPADAGALSTVDSAIHEQNGADGAVSDAQAASPDAGHAPAPDAGVQVVDAGMPDAAQPAAVTRSDMMGGTQGGAFDDAMLMPVAPEVKSITLRSGDRLDYIEFLLRDGTRLGHGGSGGSAHTLELALGEFITYARLCTGEHDSSTRVFYARLGTNKGNEVEGGVETSVCTNFTAPEGRQIAGLYGRSGYEVDALGFLYVSILP